MRFNLLICLLPALLQAAAPWRQDAQQTRLAPQKQRSFPSPLASSAQMLIRFHQQVISPVDGPRSHFRPTSSQYMATAIARYGLLKGWIIGCDRLLRENEELWVYRQVTDGGKLYKWDPVADRSGRNLPALSAQGEQQRHPAVAKFPPQRIE